MLKKNRAVLRLDADVWCAVVVEQWSEPMTKKTTEKAGAKPEARAAVGVRARGEDPFNSVKMRKIGFYNYGKTEREKDTFKIGDKVDYYPDEKKVDKKKVDKKKVIHNCVVTEVYEKGKFSTGDLMSCIVLFIMKPRLSLILQQISSLSPYVEPLF